MWRRDGPSAPTRPLAVIIVRHSASCREDHTGAPTARHCWGTCIRQRLDQHGANRLRSWVGSILSGERGPLHSCGVARTLGCTAGETTPTVSWATPQQDRLTPVAVAGGLRFRQMRAGSFHTCGVTTANVAYCWGLNSDGQLGDGTRAQRLAPVRVAGGPVSPGDGRRLPHLRHDHGKPGLLLGKQPRWPTRHRLLRPPQREADTGCGLRCTPIPTGARGWSPQLRRNHNQPHLLLGRQFSRRARRWHHQPAAETGSGRGGAPVPLGGPGR